MATAAFRSSIAFADRAAMTSRVFAEATASLSRNRWLALGVAATVVLVVVVLLGFAGVIGGRSNPKRDAVAAYIEQVNATQRGIAKERQRVNNVYIEARTKPAGLAGQVGALEQSARTLRLFDRRLRALDPPPEAAELDRRLLALSGAEATFAVEIARLGRYLPALAAERRAVGVAGARLQRDLSSSSAAVGAQAATFDRFAVAVAAAAKPLQEAVVPVSLAPVKVEELSRTAHLSATAHELAVALRSGHSADAQALVQEFGVVAAGNGNAVERKAVIAFDAQARRIDTLRLKVAEEHSRLDRSLESGS
jgi:hypothetical protein